MMAALECEQSITAAGAAVAVELTRTRPLGDELTCALTSAAQHLERSHHCSLLPICSSSVPIPVFSCRWSSRAINGSCSLRATLRARERERTISIISRLSLNRSAILFLSLLLPSGNERVYWRQFALRLCGPSDSYESDGPNTHTHTY